MTSPAGRSHVETARRRGRGPLFVLAAVAIVVLAVALRAPRLGERPMHCDEAVHAVKFCSLLEGRGYRYDPTEYHGPTLYYFTLPLAKLAGVQGAGDVTESLLRALPVIFGVGVVALTFLVADGLGVGAVLFAALLASLSPALVYYSRYYIQETLLVCFAFAMIASLWRYLQRPHAAWAMAAGASAGLMFATKETCVLNWAAMAAAAGVVAACRLFPREQRPGRPPARTHLLLAVAAGFVVAAVFLTSFFANPRGLWDSVATFARYSDRAGGEGHEKPWYYFIGLLVWTRREGVVWTEMMVLALAAAGLVAMLLRTREPRPALPVFLAVYTLAQIAIYAVIPYKTPWLALGFIHGLVLLAGFGAQECWRLAGNPVAKLLIGATLTAGVAQLAAQSCRANFRYAADERNPWVYSHTSTDAPRLVRNIRDAAALDPQGKAIVIKIITPEYWPLPWYLRDFQRVGYWNDVPDDPQAPIVITTAELANKVVAKLKGDYARDFAGLRPGFVLEVFVRRDLWEGMIAARSRPARP